MSITVVGHGGVMATPDVLRLHLGVEVTRPNTVEALAAAAEAVGALRHSLAAGGVSDEDVRTSDVTLRPYVLQDGQAQRTVYASSTIFWVTIRQMDRAGQVIDSAMTSTGDYGRIYGLSYDFADDEEVQSEARARAFADAQSKAEQYAKLAGLSLGSVVDIREGSGGGGWMVAQTSRGAGTNVSPGQQERAATVTVVFDASSSTR